MVFGIEYNKHRQGKHRQKPKFYVFYDTASKCDHQQAFNFYTYKISENVDCGKSIDLHMDNLPAMPMKAHCYKITHDGLTIEGEVNANIMPMLFRYPQMEIGDYAGVCETESQRHIAAQLKGALDTLP